MRPHIRAFFESCAAVLPCPSPIVEIGSFRVAEQDQMANMRPLFAGRDYIGCDMRWGTGVDRIEDIHQLSFEDGQVGTLLLADTLEHVSDPIRAMEQCRRCLSDCGVIMYTSVMHFPIHAYPNDYWRFTPEAFRTLASGFGHSAIFFSGDSKFPHSVCGVATNSDAVAGRFPTLAEQLAEIKVAAPAKLEGHAARLVRHLAAKLMANHPKQPSSQSDLGSFEGQVTRPNWVLTSGDWIAGWVSDPRCRAVQVSAGNQLLIETQLDGTAESGKRQFRAQVDVARFGDTAASLSLFTIDPSGSRALVSETSPGLILGEIPASVGFVMHSLDQNSDQRQRGRELVGNLQDSQTPVVVDLGCGFRKQGNVGIDVTRDGTQADLVCRLGFEPIPLDDNSADEVVCRDFLEHLPKAYYSERKGGMVYPVIDLFNEIWRILKPGGVFTSKTPCYPKLEVHQDPTHLSVWTEESMAYFCGKYPVAKLYGVRSEFALLENKMEDFYLFARLQKPERHAA